MVPWLHQDMPDYNISTEGFEIQATSSVLTAVMDVGLLFLLTIKEHIC